ncbi:MAG: hypothetical protein REI11_20010, partial [Patulibacter sp.]|nr:hypothetical protein [Patulibacter sp.]
MPGEPTEPAAPAGEAAPAVAGDHPAVFSAPPPRIGNPVVRGLVALAGAGLFVVGLLGFAVAAFVALASITPPNPFEGDGLFTVVPDDWGQAFRHVAFSTALAGLDAGAFVVSIGLLGWAGATPWPRLRILLGVPAGSAAIVLAGLGVALFLQRGDAVTAPSCRTFDFDRAAFLRNDERQALGVVHCGVVRGQTKAQVDRLLGKPDTLLAADGRDDGDPAVQSGTEGRVVGWYGLV